MKLAGCAGLGLFTGAAFDTARPLIARADGKGYSIEAEGAFVKLDSPDSVTMRALSLEPKIRITAKDGAPEHLEVIINNVHGKLLKINGEGFGEIVRSEKEIRTSLPVAKIGKAELTTEYVPPRGETLNFIAVSDTHLGADLAEEHFPRIIDHINARRPDFAADAGDIIDVDEAAQWAVFEQKDALLGVPFFTTIGNHDSYLSTNLYKQHLGKLYYGFTAREAQFLFLDNAQKFNNATLVMSEGKPDAQWNWLEKKLAEPARHRFVLFHFPMFGNRSMLDPQYLQRTPPEKRKAEVDKMVDLFRKAGVEYIMFGHLHSADRQEIDGLIHYRLGGGGGSKASSTEDRDVNFAHFFIDDKGIREYRLFSYFDDSELKRIEFCETPETVYAGVETPLIVNGVAENRLLAIKPSLKVVSGDGRIESGNIFTGGPGGVTVAAEYAGRKAEIKFKVEA